MLQVNSSTSQQTLTHYSNVKMFSISMSFERFSNDFDLMRLQFFDLFSTIINIEETMRNGKIKFNFRFDSI